MPNAPALATALPPRFWHRTSGLTHHPCLSRVPATWHADLILPFMGLPVEDPLRVGASAILRAVTAPFVGAPGTQHRRFGHRRGSPLVPVPAGASDEEHDPMDEPQHPPASPLPSPPPSQRAIMPEMWTRFAA